MGTEEWLRDGEKGKRREIHAGSHCDRRMDGLIDCGCARLGMMGLVVGSSSEYWASSSMEVFSRPVRMTRY